ncbi:sensor histidine kinase [Enterococcus sp. BWR-S5]|uniref:sensor histidine kinase n=1 Tax=Enterococcus sp. BWR-S5 TaxID=2787714 RepID=UPI0019206027|nr:HAMP domain-containing sensor histidine kinase [Enterococcus sp. BWR-S5]MBL1225563.1 HAMP domain-containing histidine kinase [Enterococcus sp. BWR-S5]
MLPFILGGLLLFLVIYLLFLLLDLREIIHQLTYIVTEETNAELVSTSKISLIRRLLDENNRLIRKNKRYYQEQRKKEKQLHQLLSNLTHDLKTPLTVSSGYTQLLLKDPDLVEKQDMLKKVDTSLASISHYLGYLMEYNLIQEKGVALELEQLNVSELLRENLFTFYEEFQEKEMMLEIDIIEEALVISDRTVLQRIFQNVLGNMLKHGYQYSEVKMYKEEESLMLCFTNGLKHPITDPQQLFQRFLTEDVSRSNKSTGLGLHIVKELVELVDGEIRLSADEGSFELIIKLKNSLGHI